jgi:prepilin-type processing-associated H-X9-DG protein/prepilin-type N-terminal cleavage/methylation domain-containing protein
MERNSLLLRRRRLAFTLVEMLVVLGIIGLLAGLGLPAFSRAIQSAQSTKCASNLRTIGVAVSQAASDNDNQYPEISQMSSSPYPTGSAAKDLYDTLNAYGVTSNDLECPTDGKGPGSAYALYGSSYEWNPAFDDEVTVTPILFASPTVQIPVNSSRVHLCYDFNPIHNGRPNYLYGDGHVKAHQ